jgi:hypothetical protein
VKVDGFGSEEGTFDIFCSEATRTEGGDPCLEGVRLIPMGIDEIDFQEEDGNYIDEATCDWSLECMCGNPWIKFMIFNSEEKYDFVQLFDGADTQAPQLTQPLSGALRDFATTELTATGDKLLIEFNSDTSIGAGGFLAQIGCRGVDDECSQACASSPCQNEGACNPTLESYQCICTCDNVGDNCELPADPCGAGPCTHGDCAAGCRDQYICTCNPSWTGTDCDADVDECEQNNGGCGDVACVNGPGRFSCGADLCNSQPCNNGGACANNPDATYACECTCDFKGEN